MFHKKFAPCTRKEIQEAMEEHPVWTYFNVFIRTGVWDETCEVIEGWTELFYETLGFFLGTFLVVWKLLCCSVLYPFYRLYIVCRCRYQIIQQRKKVSRNEDHQAGQI